MSLISVGGALLSLDLNVFYIQFMGNAIMHETCMKHARNMHERSTG